LAVLIPTLAIWGYVDVRRRGELIPGHVEFHSTDFTVYTTAGAAFFDGRDPYEVSNPRGRGWTYLYPPLFALMVAPLARLDYPSQVVVWYVISVCCAFGCFFELRYLWRFVVPRDSGGTETTAYNPARVLGGCALLTVSLPALECLQRGQVVIALLYPLLLGLRLTWTGRSGPVWCLAGLVLAWPVSVKVVPALPVSFLLGLLWLAAIVRNEPTRARVRAAAVTVSVALGIFLFTFALPTALIGWGPNLHHLHTWLQKVGANADMGKELKVDVDNNSNQSFTNAAYLLSARMHGLPTGEAPADFNRNKAARWLKTLAQIAAHRRADSVTRGIIQGVRVVVLTLLLAVGWWTERRRDSLGQVAAYGLACLAIILISPVAWSNYYVLWLPAALLVPLWLARRGRPRTARVLAAVPVGLVSLHYVLKSSVGYYGVLGLGMLGWFLAASVLLIRLGSEARVEEAKPHELLKGRSRQSIHAAARS
jgi:hypothetical protein